MFNLFCLFGLFSHLTFWNKFIPPDLFNNFNSASLIRVINRIKFIQISQFNQKQTSQQQQMIKKHLTSIQSTRPGEQCSIFSYDDRQMKFTYNTSILRLFDDMLNILKLRSYLLYRDFQEIFQNNQTLFQKVFVVFTLKDFWHAAFPHKGQNQKIYQKDQIAFLVKLVLQMDKIRKQLANDGQIKQFQIVKNAIELLEQQTAVYEQKIRNKKNNDKMQKKLKQKQTKFKDFQNFEQNVKKSLQTKQNHIKEQFLQKIHLQTMNTKKQMQKTQTKFSYKLKPSKLLSEAKDLSLRAKLSPYAAELKRSYDYKTLENSLSKTLDLDMTRRLSLISHMKKVQKERLDRDHKKRYSVLEDRLTYEKNLTQRELIQQKLELQNAQRIDDKKVHESSFKKQHSRVQSLQKSFNAYNMHSDTRQIRHIIRNHRQSVQFSNQIQSVANLSTQNAYQPKYGTLTNAMLEPTYEQCQIKRQHKYENKILQRFTKSIKQKQQQEDSDQEADNICGSQAKILKRREKSLVALYDNEMNQVK